MQVIYLYLFDKIQKKVFLLMGMSGFVEFESHTGIVLLEHDIYNLGGSELSRGTAVITHT